MKNKQYLKNADYFNATSSARRCLQQIHNCMEPLLDVLVSKCMWDFHEDLDAKCDALVFLIDQVEENIRKDTKNDKY